MVSSENIVLLAYIHIDTQSLGTTTETVLICDVTATTARLNLNNSLVNETVESFTINVIATEIVGEPSVREGQAANTLASCLVGNVTNKTLTLPGTTTSAPLMDLSMLTPGP